MAQLFNCARFFGNSWTSVCQALLSMEFSRQEYWWKTCHFLLQGKLPDPGIKPASPALAGGFFTTEPPLSHCLLPQYRKVFLFLYFLCLGCFSTSVLSKLTHSKSLYKCTNLKKPFLTPLPWGPKVLTASTLLLTHLHSPLSSPFQLYLYDFSIYLAPLPN